MSNDRRGLVPICENLVPNRKTPAEVVDDPRELGMSDPLMFNTDPKRVAPARSVCGERPPSIDVVADFQLFGYSFRRLIGWRRAARVRTSAGMPKKDQASSRGTHRHTEVMRIVQRHGVDVFLVGGGGAVKPAFTGKEVRNQAVERECVHPT